MTTGGVSQGGRTSVFMAVGALVGAGLTLLWGYSSPGEDQTRPDTQILVFMGVILVPLGATLGAAAAAIAPSGSDPAPMRARLLTGGVAFLVLLGLWQLFSFITGAPGLL